MNSSIADIRNEVQTHGATLIAVSKTHPTDRIMTLYDLGIRDFGENKVQELVAKAEVLPTDIRWHLIGHLQTNKVKAVLPFVHLIHAVDSLRLLEEIEKQAARIGRVVPFLFQIRIAREETKYGIPERDLDWIGRLDWTDNFKHVQPLGVMGMASFTDDTERIRSEFRTLHRVFDNLKQSYFPDRDEFREISMGMSSDFKTALEEGSTMVRIGSLLFGSRNP